MRMHISIETENAAHIQAIAQLLGGMNVTAPAPIPAVIVEETANTDEAPAATEAKRRGRPPKAEASATAATPAPLPTAAPAPTPDPAPAPAEATGKKFARTDLTPYGIAIMGHNRAVFKELLGTFGLEKLGAVTDDKVQELGTAMAAKCEELKLKVG